MSFHVFKPEKAQAALTKPQTVRWRRTVSCMPCRQLKVKCDRNTPCGRCVSTRKHADCAYCEYPQKTTAISHGEPQVINVEQSTRFIDDAPRRQERRGNEESDFARSTECSKNIPTSTPCSVKSGVPWYTPKSALRGGTHWDGMLHQVSTY